VLVDIHAHVTTDVAAQLVRMDVAGVGRSVLLMTRVHPEAAPDLAALRAEFGRLAGVIGGRASPVDEYLAAMKEVVAALEIHPDRFAGFVNAPLDLDADETAAWLSDQLGRPGMVGIGELTPAPDRAGDVEAVLRVSADHGGVPVLVHGFAPNTAGDIATYAELARRHRTVPLVVGAFGGLHSLQLIEAAAAIPNLHVDLSSALQVPAVRAAVAAVPEQCLFGSNTPYGDVAAARATVEAAVLDPVLREQVLGGNALRLLER
jgi:predicted TIM-barrel fold metal-dependent hydrolase